jgi:hypothetical protein
MKLAIPGTTINAGGYVFFKFMRQPIATLRDTWVSPAAPPTAGSKGD